MPSLAIKGECDMEHPDPLSIFDPSPLSNVVEWCVQLTRSPPLTQASVTLNGISIDPHDTRYGYIPDRTITYVFVVLFFASTGLRDPKS